MRAVIVCVDYSDLLSVTLPYNWHHFDEVCIVTAPHDEATQKLRSARMNTRIHVTDAFYRNGADFNKWLALEEGLDAFGRDGWLCLLDPDILIPIGANMSSKLGQLRTPRRRMMLNIEFPVPPESKWKEFMLHPNEAEFAGYCQVFHAEDEILGKPPWHETDWKHAGGADSFFQRKWNPLNKVRPDFEVLHLGPAGVNWCGRTMAMLDGKRPNDAAKRMEKLIGYMKGRRGKSGDDRFTHEKL